MTHEQQQEPNLHEQATEPSKTEGATTNGETTSAITEGQSPELSQSPLSFDEAMAKAEQEEVNDLPAVIGFVEGPSGGKSRFIPSTDSNRKVAILSYGKDGTRVKFNRISKKASEGISIIGGNFGASFNKPTHTIEPKTEVTIILHDGRKLSGYVVNHKKVYFPFKLWPQEITPPTVSKPLELRAKALILG
ncbi:MAG: hypothetical protein ACLQQ4_15195 [Bacteroidia bacterium]